MPFTDLGKHVVMSEGIDSQNRFIALHLANGIELNGNGYTRRLITPVEMQVSAAGVITGPANLEIFTAAGDNAQRPVMMSLYRTINGNDQLVEPENLENTAENPLPAAPLDTQSYRVTLTLNP